MAEHAQTIERKLAAAVIEVKDLRSQILLLSDWSDAGFKLEASSETLAAIRGDK